MNKLAEVLAKRKEYTVEGMLNKNKIAQDARSYSPNLINLLLADAELKGRFFTEAEEAGVLVFKKDIFLQFILNKQFLPDSYTKYKIKIGLGAEDGTSFAENQNVVLNFPYKDCVLEGGQDKEDQKRSEVFFNEVLAPDQITRLLDDKVFINWKRYDKDGEKPLDELKDDDNLIIKGNNLVVLHSLKKRYAGKVKLIYIDPPYYFSDTKSDDSFAYNSNFKLSTWLVFMQNRLSVARKLLREDDTIFVQISDDGFAHLRLLLDEVFGRENYLNTVSAKMKNIAGASGGGQDKKLKKNIEYILIYSKNKNEFSSFKGVYDYRPLVDLLDEYRDNGISWKYTSVLFSRGDKEYVLSTVDGDGNEIKVYKRNNPIYKSISQIIKEHNLSEADAYKKYIEDIYTTAMPQSSIRPRVLDALVKAGELDSIGLYSIEYVPRTGKNKGKLYEQFYKGDKFRLFTWLKDVTEVREDAVYKKELQGTYWSGFNLNNLSKEGSVQLDNGKKPEQLLQRIIEMSTNEGDIVLDYHIGSGTTCAVSHKLNRKYIGIEQLNYGKDDSIARLQNVINGDQSGISKEVDWQGGGDFVYCELMNTVNEYRERVKRATDDAELMSLLDEASKSSFISYRVDPDELHPDEFSKLSRADKQKALLELIDNNTLYMNYEDINDPSFGVSEKDKEFNKKLYQKEA